MTGGIFGLSVLAAGSGAAAICYAINGGWIKAFLLAVLFSMAMAGVFVLETKQQTRQPYANVSILMKSAPKGDFQPVSTGMARPGLTCFRNVGPL